jgi:ribosome-associated protein
MVDANGGDSVFVTRSLSIPAAELEWRFSRSGGPGGQHANKTSSRAEVRFDIASSPSLGPRQRTRLLERFGPEIRVVADDERSQSRNRSLALERLAGRLRSALTIQKPRFATAPSASSERRRLESKKRHANIKRQRSQSRGSDED